MRVYYKNNSTKFFQFLHCHFIPLGVSYPKRDVVSHLGNWSKPSKMNEKFLPFGGLIKGTGVLYSYLTIKWRPNQQGLTVPNLISIFESQTGSNTSVG